MDDYEKNQAKTRYDIAAQELSYIQDSIRVKVDELSSLQIVKEEFSKIYEKFSPHLNSDKYPSPNKEFISTPLFTFHPIFRQNATL